MLDNPLKPILQTLYILLDNLSYNKNNLDKVVKCRFKVKSTLIDKLVFNRMKILFKSIKIRYLLIAS